MPRRTMMLKMRLRNKSHEVVVPCSCHINELKVATLAVFKAAAPEAKQHEDLKLVFKGAVLDAAKGLPLIELGIDGGCTILAVPCVDRNREISLRAKVMGAPSLKVKLPAAARVVDVKRTLVSQLPADIVARYPQLPRWQVFLSRGSGDAEGVQRMGDDETLALHRLEDSSTVLFLVPAAGMVALSVALGPIKIQLPDHKERLLGLDSCYAPQLAQCRTELKAQLDREADREKAEAERAARRAKRLAKQQAAKKMKAQKKEQPKQHRKEREAGKEKEKENSGFARGFFAPARSRKAASSPVASPVASPQPKPLRAADSNVTQLQADLPPTWQQQQVQQQKRRLQRQRQQEQQEKQQRKQPPPGHREMTNVECAAVFLRQAYRRRMPDNEVGAFLTSRGLTQAEQQAAFTLASSVEIANADGQSAAHGSAGLARISERLQNEL